jgi:hypothetical protein
MAGSYTFGNINVLEMFDAAVTDVAEKVHGRKGR